MPNTSASDSLCFHLDYQTNAPSSLKVIPCVLRTSRKMNVHWKRHVSQYKKKKDDSDKVFRLLCYLLYASVQFSSVSQSCPTLWEPMNHSTPGLPITNSQSPLKFMFIKLVMPSSHLILCRPLRLLPPITLSIRVFSNESHLPMRWPKYWSFSFSISPSKKHPGLIFRMDALDLLAVQGTFKSLL